MHKTPWVKAAKSGGNGGDCVEMRRNGDVIQVRDSKHTDGPVLSFTRSEFIAFLHGARGGEFDHLLEA